VGARRFEELASSAHHSCFGFFQRWSCGEGAGHCVRWGTTCIGPRHANLKWARCLLACQTTKRQALSVLTHALGQRSSVLALHVRINHAVECPCMLVNKICVYHKTRLCIETPRPESLSIGSDALMSIASFKLCSFAGFPLRATSGRNSSSVLVKVQSNDLLTCHDECFISKQIECEYNASLSVFGQELSIPAALLADQAGFCSNSKEPCQVFLKAERQPVIPVGVRQTNPGSQWFK
jgi:hypothetical protein